MKPKKINENDQRERERSEQREREASQSSNQGKSEDIALLEKQGRCSQKLRNNVTGNLAHVTQTVGQNMTDISNIGHANASKVRHLYSFYLHLRKLLILFVFKSEIQISIPNSPFRY